MAYTVRPGVDGSAAVLYILLYNLLYGAGMAKLDAILKRGKTWHLYRRVPVAYHGIESRRLIFRSLKTDSEALARQKAEAVWLQMIEAWEARLGGDGADAERRFEAAQRLAQARGYRFLDASRVAVLPMAELLDRIEAVPEAGPVRAEEAAALLGGTEEPTIAVSRALDLYWGLTRDRVLGKSADQLRRWENPRKKAVKNFIDVVGDKVLAVIDGDDMLDFREWWVDRKEALG